MRILLICPRLPYPPDKGDRLTVYNYLKYFHRKHHQVTLLTFGNQKEHEMVEVIKPFCTQVIVVRHHKLPVMKNAFRTLYGAWPFQVSYYANQPEMTRVVQELIHQKDFDILYCHTLRMAEYVKHIQTIPKILALQISLALNYSRLRQFSQSPLEKQFYSLEYRLVRDYEYAIARYFDDILLISRADLEEIEKRGQRSLPRVTFLPHGVDHQFFTPRNQETDQSTMVITGNMAYPPNQDAVLYFCKDIFPLIREKRPDSKVLVVGKNPPYSLKKFDDGSNVLVTGTVPDIREYLARATVGVVPTRIAAGLQNKLLEGMSMGVPMVATSNANEGIGARNGEHVLLADDLQTFAGHVLGLMEDEKRRRQLGMGGRRFIEDQFTWDFFLEKLERLMLARTAGHVSRDQMGDIPSKPDADGNSGCW